MTLPTRSIKQKKLSTSTCMLHKELKTYKIEGVGGRDVPDFRKIDFSHTRESSCTTYKINCVL